MSGGVELRLPVLTSPFAALLAGVGVGTWLADLVQQLTGDESGVRVAAGGGGIIVSAGAAVDLARVTTDHYRDPLPPWLRTAKNGPPPPRIQILDYEAERRHNADYFEALKRLRKSGTKLGALPQEERETLEARAPRREWPAAALVNQLGAIGAYNKAVERWLACRAVYPALVGIIFELCSGRPDALERAERAWAALAAKHALEKSPYLSATQIVNPEQGKGANRPKADALTIGGREGFWVLEYFKFAGLYGAALPRMVQGKKDRKTYVVLPSREGVDLYWHQQIFGEFQRDFWPSSAIKMDILAALRYTATMLEEWEGARRSGGRRRKVSDYVEGFAVASYKDLGSAVAVMNVATVGLPVWVSWPDDADEAQRLGSVLDDHLRLIGALEEAKGEEEELLRDYRDFLSSRDPALTAFFAFTTGYAGYVLRAMNKGRRVRRLTTDNLEVIVMAQEEQRPQKLRPILDNSGFQHIATAIRQSTVIQQYYNDGTYETRYGLANDLHRASRNNGEFMRALGKFLQEFSQENARAMERARERKQQHRRRIPITTGDIAEVAALVDDYGAPTVASLIIAFGYARDPRVQDDGTAPPADEPAAAEVVSPTNEPIGEGVDAEQPY